MGWASWQTLKLEAKVNWLGEEESRIPVRGEFQGDEPPGIGAVQLCREGGWRAARFNFRLARDPPAIRKSVNAGDQ